MDNLPIPSSDNSNNADKFNFFIDIIRKSRLLRRKLGQWSHAMFFNIYLADYLQDPMADFHRDMFRLTESNDNDLYVIAGFRNSGKSAILNTSFSLWSDPQRSRPLYRDRVRYAPSGADAFLQHPQGA